MRAILEVRPDTIFIQSESSEYSHADFPEAIGRAECFNSERFLSLDLNYGHDVDARTYRYLLDNGMTAEEYSFFLENHLCRHCVMGTDYYQTNEHRVWAAGRTSGSGEVFGYDEITRHNARRTGLCLCAEMDLSCRPRTVNRCVQVGPAAVSNRRA